MGPAGVGKTALASAVLADLVADGRASAEILGMLSNQEIPLGAVSPLLATAAPSTTQAGLIRRTVEAITASAGDDRVVVLVDDAHLLDDASGTLVHLLALSQKAFVVVTIRSDLPVPDGITALWKDLTGQRIDLEDLSYSETVLLAESILDGPIEPKTAQAVFDASRGNPMFVQHLIGRGRDEGALTLRDDDSADRREWVANGPMPMPASLVEAVEHRLAELSAEDRELLEVVSMADTLGVAELQTIIGPSAEDRAASLEDRGLVVAEHSRRRLDMWIAHPLYCEVIRAQMSPNAMIRARTQLAEAVTARGLRRRDDALRVAVWLLEAGAPIERSIGDAAVREAMSRSGPALAQQIIDRMDSPTTPAADSVE